MSDGPSARLLAALFASLMLAALMVVAGCATTNENFESPAPSEPGGEPGGQEVGDPIPGTEPDGTTTAPSPSVGMLGCPNAVVVQGALAAKMIAFRYKSGPSTDHFTTSEENGEFAKAAIAFCGDTSADMQLLAQIRHILQPGNEILATGGYQDQKHVGALGMFVLVKHTPRIWSQLTAGEQDLIRIMMKAALVSSAFTTSDKSAFIQGGDEIRMDGSETNHRDGNPNYPNGMVGSVIMATLYFGLTDAEQILKTYNQQAFIAELNAKGVTNTAKTYTHVYYAAEPTAAKVEATVHQPYVFHGIPLSDSMGLWAYLSKRTFDRTVQCGLNNNQGSVGTGNGIRGGYMEKGCDALPNKGKLGMLYELNSPLDSGGARSGSSYAYSGMYPLVFVEYALIALGKWQDSTIARDELAKLRIGKDDLHYKLDPNRGGGYYDLYNGKGYDSARVVTAERGHLINFALTDDILAACANGC